MRKLNISFLVLTLNFGCCFLTENAKGDPEISTSVYLPSGKIICSPNGKYSCYTESLPSGQNLYLRKAKEKILLHSTGRNLGVTWAPNSKWLAVTDNDAAGENYIMVFDVTKEKPAMIGETPFGESWTIKDWNIDDRKLRVQSYGSKDSGISPHSTTLSLK
jgi:Tol biopolymer transport system component